MTHRSSTDTIASVHAGVEREARRLHVLHAERLECRPGCSSCCVDDLTVFAAEADRIRSNHAHLLETGEPHATGACAFLDATGRCRIYAHRPYVCRTQGLPLRWIDAAVDGEGLVELRDICSLNEAGAPIESLAAEDCWTLGPTEERLARIQLASGKGAVRTPLRALFGRDADGRDAARGPSSSSRKKGSELMGDKSPKAKDKNKKQHTAGKDQKQAAANDKAKAQAPGAAKKGK